jgi:hypothetical protein
MIQFTSKQKSVLERMGYDVYDSNAIKKYNDGDFETVFKITNNEFDYHYDVSKDKNDIDRANGNHTDTGLTWQELHKLYL